MRIVRVDRDGPRFGVLESDLETVSLLQDDPFGDQGVVRSGERVDLSASRILPPVAPSKIVAVGRNYRAHVQEMGLRSHEVPSVFLKPPQTLVADGGTVVLPPDSLTTHVEHEAELAIVIGRPARHARARDAWDHIFGFTCANDVSARDVQRSDPQLTRGKGFDTFCPLGPWVTTDLDPADLAVTTTVNGELRQAGRTSQLMRGVDELVAHVSQAMTLLPGDVILTGTPAGVGPLVVGDEVSVTIEGIGTLTNTVVARG